MSGALSPAPFFGTVVRRFLSSFCTLPSCWLCITVCCPPPPWVCRGVTVLSLIVFKRQCEFFLVIKLVFALCLPVCNHLCLTVLEGGDCVLWVSGSLLIPVGMQLFMTVCLGGFPGACFSCAPAFLCVLFPIRV